MKSNSIVTLDVGGTKVNFGRFRQGQIEQNCVKLFDAHADASSILAFLVEGIREHLQDDTVAIAIGVPTIVDLHTGHVCDAVNIPAWRDYPLKAELEQIFNIDVYLNNDVNCFVAGEYAYGCAANLGQHVAGICLGTGFGTGLMLNNTLYTGQDCCAGELGGIPYLNGTLDNYCSGSFFKKHHGVDGGQLAELARQGDEKALAIFNDFAQHLAKAISYLMFVINPKVIVIGGSVAKSFDVFIAPLEKALDNFPYKKVRNGLTIMQGQLDNAALLGAAYLYVESAKQSNVIDLEQAAS